MKIRKTEHFPQNIFSDNPAPTTEFPEYEGSKLTARKTTHQKGSKVPQDLNSENPSAATEFSETDLLKLVGPDITGSNSKSREGVKLLKDLYIENLSLETGISEADLVALAASEHTSRTQTKRHKSPLISRESNTDNPSTTIGLPKIDRPKKMTEPRARAARHKGQLNFGNEGTLSLSSLLTQTIHSNHPYSQ